MRLPERILKAIQEELRHRPSKIGTALMAEYQVELRRFEANLNDPGRQDYMPALMNRIAEHGKDLREWYDGLMQDREAARRKKDK